MHCTFGTFNFTELGEPVLHLQERSEGSKILTGVLSDGAQVMWIVIKVTRIVLNSAFSFMTNVHTIGHRTK